MCKILSRLFGNIMDFLKIGFFWSALLLALFLSIFPVVAILVKVFSVVIYEATFNQILAVWLIVFFVGLFVLFFAMVIKNYCDVHTRKKKEGMEGKKQ